MKKRAKRTRGKSRGKLPKAYLRADPNLDQHPDPGAMVVLMCEANRQPHRGRFKALDRLRGVLGKVRLAACLRRDDLRELEPGLWLLVAWDEWQEGDFTVAERMARLRLRKRRDAVTKLRTGPLLHRNGPSEAVRQLGSDAAIERKRPKEGAGGRAAPFQEQPPAARPAPAASTNGSGPIPHDTAAPVQVAIVGQCLQLAELVASNEGRAATDADAFEVLRAVSATPNGVSLDDLRGASPSWLEQTLRACAAFEADHQPTPEER